MRRSGTLPQRRAAPKAALSPVVWDSEGHPAVLEFGWGTSWYETLLISLCGTLVVLTIFLNMFQVSNHLLHWRKPALQHCYLRIAFIAPIYAIFSWLSILRSTGAAKFDVFRAFYEGYVLWVFFCMMIFGAGGERAVVASLLRFVSQDSGGNTAKKPASSEEGDLHNADSNRRESSRQMPSHGAHKKVIGCYIVPPCRERGCFSCGRIFVINSPRVAVKIWKFCILQFAFLKPALSITTAVIEHTQSVTELDRVTKPLALFSVSLAMWALLSTYFAIAHIASIQKLSVPTKFIVIKLAIFMTVAQELCLHILVGTGIVRSPYCWWAGPSERCLDLMGFETPGAQRGIRTVASLVVLEMFLLQFLLLRYYGFADPALGPVMEAQKVSPLILPRFCCRSFCEIESGVYAHQSPAPTTKTKTAV